MALINCPECSREVSDTALACPHCRHQLKKTDSKPQSPPSKAKKRSGCSVVIITLLIVVPIAFLITSIDYKASSSKTKPNSTKAHSTPVAVSQYVKKYAGGYTIEVKGFSGLATEAYALRDDGTATWMWIEPNSTGGAKVVDKKTGSWEATATSITTKINGKSGIIIESYTVRNGIFVSNSSSDRYLKHSE